MTLRKNNSISHDLDKWFIIRKINILLWVWKTGKVHILHARNTLPFVVYIFFKHIFLFFVYIWTNKIASCFNNPIKFLFTCYPWFSPRDENLPVTSLSDIPYNMDTVIKLHFKKYRCRNKFIKNLIFLFISQLFCLFIIH